MLIFFFFFRRIYFISFDYSFSIILFYHFNIYTKPEIFWTRVGSENIGQDRKVLEYTYLFRIPAKVSDCTYIEISKTFDCTDILYFYNTAFMYNFTICIICYYILSAVQKLFHYTKIIFFHKILSYKKIKLMSDKMYITNCKF